MASQTQGIQQLLAAEKKAADKVAEARKSITFNYLLNLLRLYVLPWFPLLFQTELNLAHSPLIMYNL